MCWKSVENAFNYGFFMYKAVFFPVFMKNRKNAVDKGVLWSYYKYASKFSKIIRAK